MAKVKNRQLVVQCQGIIFIMSNDIKQIDAVILCGGLGTRLRSVLGAIPKVMAEINDKPFLDILVQYLKGQGVARIVLCTGHQAQLVESYFSSNPVGVDIGFSREEIRLGTGGALKNAKEKIKSDNFIVMNGDSLCKVDLSAFLEFHKAKRAVASIVVSEVKDASDFGGIEMNEDLSISAFREKESVAFGSYVNAGVYCFNKEAFSLMPDQNKFSLEYDLFPALVNKGIYGFCVDKDFMDIGTPERLEKAKDTLGDIK